MWDVEMAKMFKDRDNKGKIGPCVGKVVSVSPLKISIFNGDITLQPEQLYITRSLLNRQYSCKINNGNISELKLYFELKKNNKVLLIPTEDEQSFFIIDIVEEVGG